VSSEVRRVAARENAQQVSGHTGSRLLTATVNRAVARENERTARNAVTTARSQATEEQAEAARAVFESRRALGRPFLSPSPIMTDEDRHAIKVRRERIRLLRHHGDSSSSSSNGSSSSSSRRPDPGSVITDSSRDLAQLWDPHSTRRIRELAQAMAMAADTAEFAITAGLAVASVVEARNRAAAAATEAAMAPERVENGPGDGASPHNHPTEQEEPLARGWSSASARHRRGQGWSLRPHPAEGAPPPPQSEHASLG